MAESLFHYVHSCVKMIKDHLCQSKRTSIHLKEISLSPIVNIVKDTNLIQSQNTSQGQRHLKNLKHYFCLLANHDYCFLKKMDV